MFTRYVNKRTNSESVSSKRSRAESTVGSIEPVSEEKILPDLTIHNKSSNLRIGLLENSVDNSPLNPNYIEPKIPFTLKAIIDKKENDASVLLHRLNVLTTKFKAKDLEKMDELLEKQNIIEEKEKRIEDLEKSLVFLVSNEKEALDSIKKLETEVSEFQNLTEQKSLEEKRLEDEIIALKEKIIILETDKNSILTDLQEKSILFETNFDTIQQENFLMKEHLANLEENVKTKSTTRVSNENPLEELSAENNQQSALILSHQLNSSQESLKLLQIQLHQLSSQVSEYKKSHEKYTIALEEKRSLEVIIESLKLEITNLNEKLSDFDSQTHSWVNFFASQNEFKNIDDLWSKLTEDQKILKEKSSDLDILTVKLQHRENAMSSLTEENVALKTSLETIEIQRQQDHLALKKAEKIALLNQREIDLLKNQLAIYTSMEDLVEEETVEETQALEPSI